MKVALAKSIFPGSKKESLLPLQPGDENALAKDNSVVLELCTVPSDAASAKIKVSVHILKGDKDLWSMIKWCDAVLNRVFPSLNLTNGVNRKAMALNLMEGDPQSLFTEAVRQLATDACLRAAIAADPDPTVTNHQAVIAKPLDRFTNEDIVKLALETMLMSLMPNKALPQVKRCIRRECRKPADMKACLCFQLRLKQVNDAEIPCLLPFDTSKKFSTDEMMDITFCGVPKSWLRELDCQGIDPLEKTLGEVVEFLEQIESAEEHDSTSKVVSNNGHKKKGRKKSHSSSRGDKYCLIHGHGGHSSDECHKLQADAKHHKSSFDSKPKSSYSNKTWKHDANESSNKSKKELNAFVKKSTKEGVKKALNAHSKNNKKRKSSETDALDLNALEAELKDFSYSNMENLQIDSDVKDGEISCWSEGQNELDQSHLMDIDVLDSNLNTTAEAFINNPNTSHQELLAFENALDS